MIHRAVPAKFDHKTDYMPGIIEATKDIDVQVIFNNAGYIVTGFFDQTKLDGQLANMECNGIFTLYTHIKNITLPILRVICFFNFILPIYLYDSHCLCEGHSSLFATSVGEEAEGMHFIHFLCVWLHS